MGGFKSGIGGRGLKTKKMSAGDAKRFAALNAKMDTIENELAPLQARRAKLDDAYYALQEKIDVLTRQQDKMDNEADRLDAKIDRLDSKSSVLDMKAEDIVFKYDDMYTPHGSGKQKKGGKRSGGAKVYGKKGGR